MSTGMNDVLRDIVERHGTMLVDDVRRCEACIREAPLPKPEMAGLVAALREGIPKQLLRLPAGTLSRMGMSTLASQLAQNGGLNDALAQRAVEAWAHALQLTPTAEPRQAEPVQPEAGRAGAESPQPARAAPKPEPPKPQPAKPQTVKPPAGLLLQPTGNAVDRGAIVLGLVVLVVLMIGVAGLAVGELTRTIPWSCGDYGTPSLAPAECSHNIKLYIIGFILLGGGVGALWRKLRR